MTRYPYTTPFAETMVKLGLVGGRSGSVVLTADECHSLEKVYGFDAAEAGNPLHQAGDFRNLMRHASHDGLRLVAYMARHMERGQDPVRFLGQLLLEAGFDVPNDVEWITEGDSHVHPSWDQVVGAG